MRISDWSSDVCSSDLFGILVALADNGNILAGWIYDPVRGRMCHAALGKGAFIDETPVRARPSGAPLPIAALATFFLTPEQRAAMKAIGRASGRARVCPSV